MKQEEYDKLEQTTPFEQNNSDKLFASYTDYPNIIPGEVIQLVWQTKFGEQANCLVLPLWKIVTQEEWVDIQNRQRHVEEFDAFETYAEHTSLFKRAFVKELDYRYFIQSTYLEQQDALLEEWVGVSYRTWAEKQFKRLRDAENLAFQNMLRSQFNPDRDVEEGKPVNPDTLETLIKEKELKPKKRRWIRKEK